MGMNWYQWLATILVLVGALNWGLIGAFRFDLVFTLLGGWPMVERIVHILVGLSAIWMAVNVFKR